MIKQVRQIPLAARQYSIILLAVRGHPQMEDNDHIGARFQTAYLYPAHFRIFGIIVLACY